MNTLEDLLKKAASEPESRPAFYAALLSSQVFVIGQKEPVSNQVQIEHWEKEDGSQVIPFFSSL